VTTGEQHLAGKGETRGWTITGSDHRRQANARGAAEQDADRRAIGRVLTNIE
jgi:hypothetical protein